MEEILHQAEQSEKEYDWLGAAESYKKALTLLSEDEFSYKGDVAERLGYAIYRAAFQAEKNDEFREKMHQSVAHYLKAKEFFGRSGEPQKTPRILRCSAMIAYLRYWLASEVSEKKRLLDECWRLTKEDLKRLDETACVLEYGETYNQLSSGADHGYGFESSFQVREELVREVVQYGERAIVLLSKTSAPRELAKAYVKTAMYLSVLAWYFVSDMDEKDGYFTKGLGYWQKAVELSEETAYLELLSMSGEGLDWKPDEMLGHYVKALDFAGKTGDKYLIGTALDWLTYAMAHVAINEDQRGPHFEKALEYAEDTQRQFSPISYVSPRGSFFWTGMPYAEYYYRLAFWETDLSTKREFLKKAITYATTGVTLADTAGYPDIIMHTHYVLGISLIALEKLEPNLEEKRKLLESAVEHMKENVNRRKQLERFNYSNLGGMWQNLASLGVALSLLEENDEQRKRLLEEAISYQEQGLQLHMKYILPREKKGKGFSSTGFIGWGQYVYGLMLVRLHDLTHDCELQRKALKAFADSAEAFQRLNLASRVAESYWRVARGYDQLGEHKKAAENFNLASDNYRHAAEKIPQLKDFYHDHASYMQAWTEIEIARDHHARQEYELAREHFEKAADTHKLLIHWSYLAQNYSAWTLLEEAEGLSRKEKTEKALRTFEDAANLFLESKKTLQTQLEKIEDSDERQMVANLVNATAIRQEYCVARIDVEEARILDKKGDHFFSSGKYGKAVEKFNKIAKALETEQEKKELELIATLSLAWQKTTQAEAETSPVLYSEAAQLFEMAKELSPNEKAKMLALGHSRFCKALEVGTKFADTIDATLHPVIEQHLESAANYYVKAGFQNASEYSKAMEHLFDAYLYMDEAKRERDPEKKARFYSMAEKVLQSSVGSFIKAEHPEKTEQVRRLLEKVNEERELALSLNEMLHAPSVISTTAAFFLPAPTSENAVGLERFEHAEVNANLILDQKELKLGESLDLEIELANAGKAPAFLTQIERAVPEGFELTAKPELYRVEGFSINMKGKRLDPLKAEEVRFSLRSKHKGSFTMAPKILYVDENGNAKSHQTEPVTITVKELGIKGWLKGER